MRSDLGYRPHEDDGVPSEGIATSLRKSGRVTGEAFRKIPDCVRHDVPMQPNLSETVESESSMRPGGTGRRFRNNRGNTRRTGGGNRNQSYESTGPDVKVRGTAQQIADRYLALARDASSSGDLVVAENCLQHAEHYQRIVNQYVDQQREREERAERLQRPPGTAEDDRPEEAPARTGSPHAPAIDMDDSSPQPDVVMDDEPPGPVRRTTRRTTNGAGRESEPSAPSPDGEQPIIA